MVTLAFNEPRVPPERILKPKNFSMVFKLLILFFLCTPSLSSAIELQISAKEIALNKTLQLKIVDQSDNDLRDLSLRALEQDFDVGQPSFSSEISIINGRQRSKQSLRLNLKPKRLGNATIPPLRLGNKSTKPYIVKVVEATPNPSSLYNDAITVEANVSKTSVYAGESFLYTLKVYHKIPMESATPELKLQDKLVEANIQRMTKKEYQIERNQQRYAVQEWRFTVNINEAGKFSLPSPVVKGELYEQRRTFFRSRGVPFEIEAKPININVKPLPQNASSLLVAESLDLIEVPFKQNELLVGQPITRQIEIQVKGLKAEQLPSINISDQPMFNVYAEPPVFDNQEWLGGYAGTRRESFAIIPIQAGKITLPEIRIEWFNSKTGQIESSILPAVQMDISPANINSVNSNSLGPNTNSIESTDHTVNSVPSDKAVQPSISVDLENAQKQIHFWKILFALVCLAWIATLVALIAWRSRGVENTAKNHDDQPLATTTEHNELELRQSTIKACMQNNAAQAKHYALQWLRVVPSEQLSSEVKAALKELDNVLFSSRNHSGNTIAWQGGKLGQALKTFNPLSDTQKTAQIAQLYPTAS